MRSAIGVKEMRLEVLATPVRVLSRNPIYDRRAGGPSGMFFARFKNLHAMLSEESGSCAFLFRKDTEENVLRPDIVVRQSPGLLIGMPEDVLGLAAQRHFHRCSDSLPSF